MTTYNVDTSKTACLMVGPSNAGKTTWTQANFSPHEIYGLDAARKQLLGTLEFPKSIDGPASVLLDAWIQAQILGETTVCIDQTNLSMDRLRELRNKFKAAGYTVIVVKTVPVPLSTLHERNKAREAATGVHIPEFVITKMFRDYEALPSLDGIGDFLIDTSYTITRGANLTYKYDHVVFIGDLQGAYTKFRNGIKTYGYLLTDDGNIDFVLADAPKLMFIGDLVDRQPESLGSLKCVRAVMNLVKYGHAHCVKGNHDLAVAKLMRDNMAGKRNLTGQSPQSVQTAHEFVQNLRSDEFAQFANFLDTLPTVIKVIVAGVPYLVSHAGVPIRTGRIVDSVLTPTKHDNIYIVKGFKTGERDSENRFAITSVYDLPNQHHIIDQVFGHCNISDNFGTFVAPYIVDTDGARYICVESKIERNEAYPTRLGVYEAGGPSTIATPITNELVEENRFHEENVPFTTEAKEKVLE